ncbi:zinc finger protein 135-like [Folsomia candida]|uniref:Zinc finger imprinted 3 n=1 Tax=Folsomia candida TaxID=158441 RepID=A0A226DKU9_FOLCA|nr:zinc finger protein 135-like [Folsomia candida]XP_035713544.1 zinc finger protein 135-like [Folsomia candida]OXA45231.1 Zinc finger imprinted 3 [Folsomia candida]
MVKHDSDAKVKLCEVSGLISKSRRALSSHMWKLHRNRMRPTGPSCDTCHRVFSSLTSLRRHSDTVHSRSAPPRFPCTFPGCKKTYSYKYAVANHVKTEHVENPVRYPCTLCGKEFKTKFELEQHIPTHTTEKPYNCATCGRSFAHRGSLTRHEKTHLEKSTRARLKCHLCPQTFLRRNNLEYHIRAAHENRRDHQCAICDKRFSKSSNLKRHVEEIHKADREKIHSCDKCEYMSHSKSNLASHKVRHNAARHGCYFCQKKFFSFHELVRHCRVHTLE